MKRRSTLVIILLSVLLISCTAQQPVGSVPLATSQPAKGQTAQAIPVVVGGGQATAVGASNTPQVLTPGTQTAPDAQRTRVQPARASIELGSPAIEGTAPVVAKIVVDVGAYSNTPLLYGAEVHLTFDPAILQVQDADPTMPETQIVPGEAFPKGSSFVAVNRVNNDRGTIDFAVTLLNPAQPLQGKVVLASFSLQAKRAGAAKIGFEQVLLADRSANALPVASQNITVTAK